jgi:hypothetical protein
MTHHRDYQESFVYFLKKVRRNCHIKVTILNASPEHRDDFVSGPIESDAACGACFLKWCFHRVIPVVDGLCIRE